MKRIALMAVASSLALVAAAPASAALFVSVKIDGVEANSLLTGTIFQVDTSGNALDAGTGVYASPTLAPFSYNGVVVSLDMTGKGSSPFSAPDPQFLTNTTTVEATGAGTHTVLITLSQTGLTAPLGAFSATSTLNTQLATLGGSGSATAKAFVNNNNSVFGLGTQIGGTVSCPAGSPISCSGGGVSAATHPATYSETVQYAFTISSGRLSASTTVAGAVPEPATWGMMIVGFGLMGGVMRRRSTKVAFA